MSRAVVRVAVPSPLRQAFDYWAPPGVDPEILRPGMRVRVPLGRATRVGLILERAQHTEVPPGLMRAVEALIDAEPILPAATMELLRWAAAYYHHPVGEVMLGTLPRPLRQGRAARAAGLRAWRLSQAGRETAPAELARAPRQAALLGRLARAYPRALEAEELAGETPGWQRVLRALTQRGLVEEIQTPCLQGAQGEPEPPLTPAPAQQQAVEAITRAQGGFAAFLLEGVTGSGKTEVYLRAIESVVRAGRQALVLIPEIGLTPQMVSRFRRRFEFPVAVLHSALADGERLCAWLMAAEGRAPVVIGTRSAVFVPLRAPGILIVDEEHDASFKQQEGFRYSARDLAVVRARQEAVPVVLGSATPSLESVHNAGQGRYAHLVLSERATGAAHPRLKVLDVKGRRLSHGLSSALLAAVAAALGRGEQVLLFLNRRGYAPALMCHDCGWVAECPRCDACMTWHRGSECLRCHHCAAERPTPESCPGCGGCSLRPLGSGTERLEDTLRDAFPAARLSRIDRDSTRRKGALAEALEAVRAGTVDVLVGTQMLAKGHHFPNVTLVAVVDADGGLFSADFRAAERMSQLVVQVAGRAGRGQAPGEVLIQTHHPEHPLLRSLVEAGYDSFARSALAERQAAGLPPFSHMALIRAEAPRREAAAQFLQRAAALPVDPGQVLVLGPVPATQERRAGRYRAQLLLQCPQRAPLHRLLELWLPQVQSLKQARSVRWSVDVDPVEMG